MLALYTFNMEQERIYPQRARKQFSDIARQMKNEIKIALRPQLKAILETSAEVLNSLAKTFSDYEMRGTTKDSR